MIVQCPRCSTRWRVADPEATDNPVFKCGRCHHVFPRFPGAPAPGDRANAGRHRGAAPPAPDNLEFIFPRRPPAAEPVAEPQALSESAAAVEPSELADRDVREPDVPVEPPAPSARYAAPDTDQDEHDVLANENPTPLSSPSLTLHMEDAMSASPIHRLLFVMVALFGLLALAARSDPERASDWLARLPVVGSRLTDRPELGPQITLRNVHGGYQRLHNARRGFVISGEAVNNSLAAVERVEVEAALYDASGEVGRKIVVTGNKATLRLADLSERAISLLQDFDAHATLAPGESTSFLIVFLKPPPDVKEFSSRVRSVRPTGQASTPPSNRMRDPASVG